MPMKIKFSDTITTPNLDTNMVFLIDKKVYALFKSKLRPWLTHPQCQKIILLNAGEKLKSLKSLQKISHQLLMINVRKNTTLIGIGGGSVLDFTGLIASLWMRGIPWIAMPTTVLAMSDSSYGGKTALNFAHRKNLLGTIYHPSEIYCYFEFLKKLSPSIIYEGLSEVYKHGLIKNDHKLISRIEKILSQKNFSSTDVIKKSLMLKKKIIGKDFFEKNNKRILLNLAHTFGHVLEQKFPKIFSHGHAIWWGLFIELHLSQAMGADDLHKNLIQIEHYLKSRKNFSIELQLILNSFDDIFYDTKFDKKNNSKTSTCWIRLKALGQPVICHEIPFYAKQELHLSLLTMKIL